MTAREVIEDELRPLLRGVTHAYAKAARLAGAEVVLAAPDWRFKVLAVLTDPPAAYLLLSLRFWFYGPVIVTSIATVCFTVATVLSA